MNHLRKRAFWVLVLVLSACGGPVSEKVAPATESAGTATSNPTFEPLIPQPTMTPILFSERQSPVWLPEANTFAGYLHREFLQIPVGMVWGPDNLLYIADWTGRHVVRVGKDGTMDDLPFWKTVKGLQEDGPRGIDFDSKGNLYVSNHSSIWRIDPDGNATKLFGVNGSPIGSIAISPDDVLYYTDRAQNGGSVKRWQDKKSVRLAENLPLAENMVFGLDGALYLTQMAQPQVLKIDVNTGTVSTFKENVCGNDPCFLAVDKEGDIWARGINRLSQFTSEGADKPFVVDGETYPGGQYAWQTAAGIAFDDEGGLWVASYNSRMIRLVPVTPGQPDPEFTKQVMSPGFEAADLEAGADGEIYASEAQQSQILSIGPDGSTDVVWNYGYAGHAGLAVDGNGALYVGLPIGEIVRIEADGTTTHYASLLTRHMTFGADGALYAIVGDYWQDKSVVRITDVDTFTVIANEIAGISLSGHDSHISPALDTGLYVYIEGSCDLLHMDFNGQGRLIANVKSLGCGGPAIMGASPITGEIYLIAHGPYILYRITPDGQSTILARGIFGDPAGMIVSPDGRWLYVAESGAVDKIPLSFNNP